MKISSTIPDKAARFITEGRVLEISGAPGKFCVIGDNGNYLVDAGDQTCTCPATVPTCSHLLAAWHCVLNKES
jgi:predicted nucleic acid-binding Zn finger protein